MRQPTRLLKSCCSFLTSTEISAAPIANAQQDLEAGANGVQLPATVPSVGQHTLELKE